VVAFVYQTSLIDVEAGNDHEGVYVKASQVAEHLKLPESRALAYCDQMIGFGLLRDWWIGRYGYQIGGYSITDYGRELVEFLDATNQATPTDKL
jgi:hypothetical protein